MLPQDGFFSSLGHQPFCHLSAFTPAVPPLETPLSGLPVLQYSTFRFLLKCHFFKCPLLPPPTTLSKMAFLPPPPHLSSTLLPSQCLLLSNTTVQKCWGAHCNTLLVCVSASMPFALILQAHWWLPTLGTCHSPPEDLPCSAWPLCRAGQKSWEMTHWLSCHVSQWPTGVGRQISQAPYQLGRAALRHILNHSQSSQWDCVPVVYR